MSQPFAGKVALVTGGNSGIGKATALLFAQQGARVVIAARRAEEGEATVAEIGCLALHEVPDHPDAQPGGGTIVNDSSVAGLTGYARSTHYCASKHGVVGLSKAAALQYRDKGIRINAVCPGMIMTPMIERAFTIPGVEDWFRSKVPGRAGNPDEVAQAVTWLCSDAASYVNGVAFPVGGGLSAGV